MNSDQFFAFFQTDNNQLTLLYTPVEMIVKRIDELQVDKASVAIAAAFDSYNNYESEKARVLMEYAISKSSKERVEKLTSEMLGYLINYSSINISLLTSFLELCEDLELKVGIGANLPLSAMDFSPIIESFAF